MTNPQGLAFDAAGNLYVAYFVGDIVEYSPTGTVLNTFATALAGPVGVAFDTAGNLYVANSAGNNVVELSPTGGFIQNFAAVTSPLGLAFDAFGNLYVSDLNGQILKFSPVGTPLGVFASGLSEPFWLAFGPVSNIQLRYVTHLDAGDSGIDISNDGSSEGGTAVFGSSGNGRSASASTASTPPKSCSPAAPAW